MSKTRVIILGINYIFYLNLNINKNIIKNKYIWLINYNISIYYDQNF